MATSWEEKIKSADKYYEKWANKYKCAILEQYYRGFQWAVSDGDVLPYSLNLFYATVDIKLASYSFDGINFNIKPKPSKSDFNLEFASQVAQLKSDAVNTLIQNPNALFLEEYEQALQDSFFRFGLMEVNYSADWIDNPNAGKPLYEDSEDPLGDPEKVIKNPAQIPENEQIFFKRIDPARFRVGGIEGRYLRQCNWVGYFDFYYAGDIKSDKGLTGANKLETISHRSTEWDYSEEYDELLKKGDLLKIWTIFDLRSMNRIFWDQANDLILKETPFTRLPLFDIRWIRDRVGWYPIPPAFNWISPQDEINESRQGMRDYRRRFKAQFQVVTDYIEAEEKDKFEEGKSGGLIEVKRENAITGIQNPQLSGVVKESMIVGKDDFVLMSGSSSEAFGESDRMTATQSIEISQRTRVRENRERSKITAWICKMAREALLLAQSKMTMGFWVKCSADPGKESLMGEIQINNEAWNYILSQDLNDGVDFDISVELSSMSPMANEDEKKRFIEFVSIVQNFPQIALSPALIREAAYRVGYRNEKVIREMQGMSLLASMGQMAQGQQPGAGGDQKGQQIVGQMTPPTQEQTTNQLEGQLVQ